MTGEKESWHLSKSVPVSFIFALIVQSVVAVWFFSELNYTVKTNAERIEENKTNIAVLELDSRSQEGTLIRIEQNVQFIKEAVEDLKNDRAHP